MDERVKKLKTVEDCERFAGNARDRGYEELAQEAQARAVQLKSEKHQARSQVESECLQAVYAYEAAQSKLKGRRFHANRTWQMIKRHGILAAVERAGISRVRSDFWRLVEQEWVYTRRVFGRIEDESSAFREEQWHGSHACVRLW